MYWPMEHKAWSSAEVAKTRLAASCQNRHPAGLFPDQASTPAGTSFGEANRDRRLGKMKLLG